MLPFAAALKQRADMAALLTRLHEEIQGRGLIFNDPPFEPFRDALHDTGFYTEWRGRVPAEAWTLLEKSTGALG